MTTQAHRTDGAHQLVLDALAFGEPMTAQQLTFAGPFSIDTIRGALTELIHEKRIERVARNLYKITGEEHGPASRAR